jgi:hypothetical protein
VMVYKLKHVGHHEKHVQLAVYLQSSDITAPCLCAVQALQNSERCVCTETAITAHHES